MAEVYFGGLDLAKRVDYSAFVLLKYFEGELIQCGQKEWPHINYRVVADDMYKINQRYRMNKLCFDRSGVGDAAQELFSRELPMEEVVSSLPKKLEIINFVKSLFHNKKLLIKDKKLYEQLLEQEEYKSDAGNILYRHPSSSHDDIFWALGYACYASRQLFLGITKPTLMRQDRIIHRSGMSQIDKDIEQILGTGSHVQRR